MSTTLIEIGILLMFYPIGFCIWGVFCWLYARCINFIFCKDKKDMKEHSYKEKTMQAMNDDKEGKTEKFCSVKDLDKEEDTYTYLWNRFQRLRYETLLSINYHKKRQRFFELMKIWTYVLCALGCGTLSLVVIPKYYTAVFIGYFICNCAIGFHYNKIIELHSDLSGRFNELYSKILLKGERDFTENDLNYWSYLKAGIEIEEPPSLGSLISLCQIELDISMGEEKKRPGFIKRVIAQFID